MIITVTLNAAIDKTLEVPGLRAGQRHRSVDAATLPGGKGVNIARALKALGQPVIATGFAGGGTGTRIVQALTEESVLNDFVRIADESRTNTAVLDPTTGDSTEINERGPVVSDDEFALMLDRVRYLGRGAKMCILAGSLPLGVPADAYAQMVRELSRMGVETIVDSEGEPLRQATRAEPTVVTPNLVEAEGLAGYEFSEDEDTATAVCEISQMGPAEAIVTLSEGCVALFREGEEKRLVKATVPRQDVRSAIGSGDAFVAGYAAARYVGLRPAEAIRRAVACGAESTRHFGAGIVDPAAVDELVESVELSELPVPAAV